MSRKVIVGIVIAVAVTVAAGMAYVWFAPAKNEEAVDEVKRGTGTGTGASVEITNPVIDLGTFRQREVKKGEYAICNNGTSPLIILKAVSSCNNCIDVEYPQKPIPPGQTAWIKVTYTANSPGRFNKTIDIHTNTKPQVNTLRIEGVVTE